MDRKGLSGYPISQTHGFVVAAVGFYVITKWNRVAPSMFVCAIVYHRPIVLVEII
jgi:hypothetical protein